MYSGLLKGSSNGYPKTTLVYQLREDKDCLDCEMWQYFGEISDDKLPDIIQAKDMLLELWNRHFETSFTKLVIDWEGENY